VLIRGECALPGGRVEQATLRFRGRSLVEVRAPRLGDPAPHEGLLVPGLVNAHTHLELGGVGLVSGGDGLPAWVERQLAARASAAVGLDAVVAGARSLPALGVAAVCDVGACEGRAAAIAQAGVSGVASVELIGLDPQRRCLGLDRARAGSTHRGERAVVVERAGPHAPYSTHPDVARACAAPVEGRPTTLHLAEDPAEDRFLRHGDGPWAALLDRLGVAWREVELPGPDPVSWLASVGLLGPQALVVHGVTLDRAGFATLARARAPLCLCVRSNLHIGGRAPDVGGAVQLGVPLALGTDGLVSCPDLDVLGEIPALARLAPQVPIARWLQAATEGGARALGLPGLGSLEVGSSPGLLQLDSDPSGLAQRAPGRRWLVSPGLPAPKLPEAA